MENNCNALSIMYCPEKRRFVTTRFLHVSSKPINLLELIPSQLSLDELHSVLHPKLGQRFQAVQEEGFQLRLLVNLKPGAELLASPNSNFLLPSVVIMETTSSTFAKFLLHNPISHLEKYLQQTNNLEETCNALLSAHKHEQVLRLRVTSSDINVVRRLWPFLWTHWTSIVLWSHQKEQQYRHPPIRKVRVPFSMEVERMLAKCPFIQSDDLKVSALRELSVRVNLLFQSIDIPNTRKMSLKQLVNTVVYDASTSSSVALISRVCGLSKLRNLSQTILKEIGFILNRLTEPMSWADYINTRSSACFFHSEAEVTLTKRTENSLWHILKRVEALGLITCQEIKTAKVIKRRVLPQLPSCLRETLMALFCDGEMECIKAFRAFSNEDEARQQILVYMSKVSKAVVMGGRTLISDVRANTYLSFEPIQELHIKLDSPSLQNVCQFEKELIAKQNWESQTDSNATEYEVFLQKLYNMLAEKYRYKRELAFVESGDNLPNQETQLHSFYDESPATIISSLNRDSQNKACGKVKETVPAKTYNCETCGREFTSKIGLKNHKRVNAKSFINANAPKKYCPSVVTTHCCNICKKNFAKKSNLKRHLQIHIKTESFECVFCKSSLARREKLFMHLTMHIKEKPFACKLCPKAFSESRKLQRHNTSHNSSHLKCWKCSASFLTKQALLEHKKSDHKSSWRHSCTFCKKGIQRREHFENHIRVHTKEKPFACKNCQKEFTVPFLALGHNHKCSI